jgi:phosphate transport system substrate-binding protein
MFRIRALCVLVVVASLTGCGSSSKSAPNHTSAAPPPLPSESPACGAGSLQLIGSTAFAPIAQAAANAYMQQCASAKITVTGGDSDYGLTQVQNAVATRSPSAGSMIAMYDGLSSDTTGLSPYPMGVLIFSVVAHAGLFPARNLTASELRKIFAKPGEQGIVAVGRRAGSGSRKAFVANVLGGKGVPPDKGNCPVPTGNRFSFTSCTEDSTADVLKFVNSTPNAIGYAVVSPPLTGYPDVAVLSIDNVVPRPDYVRNGSYRFWAVENLYAATQPTMLAREFLEFLSHYTDPNLPPDFIPCTDAPKALGTGC